ncbi:DUF7344 domain-containing protein [Halorientalis brevis]|uniref:DUF7344 domain-containing protein n=1 Tax=Halorientalis brevis TaxID=1126241 RepID=UPI003D0CDB7C
MPHPSAKATYRRVARHRRQSVLTYLREADDRVVPIDELADYVASQESESLSSQRDTITVDLAYVHLPLLDDMGVIEFDRRSERVRFDGHAAIDEAGDAITANRGETPRL